MRKFILFLTGGLIILSILFIFVNNFIETRNNHLIKSTNEEIVLNYNKIIDIVNKLKS
ncbi:GAG-binding domain-containing protein [Capnocytophaga sputigena]|uniref:GAG-binding domain-containing protein n=1 Tax=Capnocytophaga sputigena TaxID=1019 RepID=UPI0012FF6AE7|nr:GAG-binding domain-containing protein [Capnocytophaga sputigena]